MNFTQKQYDTLHETLVMTDENNANKLSNCKISQIKTFKDPKNNLYVSYFSEDRSGEGVTKKMIYLKIVANGKREVLNYTYAPSELEKMFDQLELVKI